MIKKARDVITLEFGRPSANEIRVHARLKYHDRRRFVAARSKEMGSKFCSSHVALISRIGAWKVRWFRERNAQKDEDEGASASLGLYQFLRGAHLCKRGSM